VLTSSPTLDRLPSALSGRVGALQIFIIIIVVVIAVHVSITTQLACFESEANKLRSINIDLADCVYSLLRVL